MALVDPFVIPLPRKLALDPEVAPWFTYLQKFLHDLWKRTGAGTDLVGDAVTLAQLTSTLAVHTASNDNTTQAEMDAAFVAHLAAGNPHPVYTTDAEVATAIAAHVALSDPHPTYTTAAELAAAIAAHTSSADNATDAEVAAAITAHEGAGNPHPTYLTQAEGDAAYEPLGEVAAAIPDVADDFADDAAAAIGGIGVGELYHTSGAVKLRLS
jgi:hypothetical protein